MASRVPVQPPPASAARVPSPSALPTRNRRTALGLVAWIFLLMLVSMLVAWFRN